MILLLKIKIHTIKVVHLHLKFTQMSNQIQKSQMIFIDYMYNIIIKITTIFSLLNIEL